VRVAVLVVIAALAPNAGNAQGKFPDLMSSAVLNFQKDPGTLITTITVDPTTMISINDMTEWLVCNRGATRNFIVLDPQRNKVQTWQTPLAVECTKLDARLGREYN
jgi:hypothetical protein